MSRTVQAAVLDLGPETSPDFYTHLKEFYGWVGRVKQENKALVFTNGCFDLFGSQHLYLLTKAATFGDVLLVAVNSDKSVRRLKGDKRPIYDQQTRASLVAAVGCVDMVCIFHEDTPVDLLRTVRPYCLVKGDMPGQDTPGWGYASSSERVPLLEGYSTTRTIAEIVRRYRDVPEHHHES